MADEERVVSLGRLARELDPVLEAVLVGSLVRADRLDGVLLRPGLEAEPEIEDLPDDRDEGDGDGDGHGEDEGDGDAVGAGLDALYAAVRQTVHAGRGHVIDDDDDVHDAWRRGADTPSPLGREAIERALGRLYHGVEPAQHFVAPVLYELGGRDPLHRIVAYLRADPRPHFHVVTYGFSEQFGDGADPDATSGYGFELTLRLARTSTQTDVPRWAIRLLQDLGRAVFEGGDRFAAGDARALPSPLGDPPLVAAVGFVDDPELGAIGSPLGHARFLQVVGLTHDEHHAMLAGQRHAILALLGAVDPYLITDPRRLSVLADWARAQDLARKIGAEGSSEVVTVVDALAVVHDADRVRLVVSALAAEVLPHAMRGRLAHGRSATLRNGGRSVTFERGEVHGYQIDDRATTLVVHVTAELAREIEAALLVPHVGVVRFATWSRLEIEVTPTYLRDDAGEVIGVRGFADPAAATAAIEAQRRQEAADADVEADAAAEADVDVDVDAGAALEPPSQVVAALAMTARALRLAPHDADTQYAHAMLMIDAERAGTGGAVVDLLPRFTSGVRIAVAVRLGALAHRRFGDAVDAVVGAVDPAADVASELYAQLGAAILRHVPTKMAGLIGRLPDDIELLCDLASQAIEVEQRAHALALYDRVLALPMPLAGDVDERAIYLMALHDACLQAYAARAFDVAVRLADRAQPVAHENPYLYHAAACAYAAVGELTRALDQIKLAIAHDYEHVERIERDLELGALSGSSELAAVFAAWHAGQART
ncbi:MAG: suppressor of fused domain protein [Proteobacteria bacterium]|nr:suppressor of fused domain protein [Pseudomonadota bacterium]